MNSIDLTLLKLIQIAESPVYSAYRWLGREIGRELSMTEFFRILAPLLEDDVVRLWAVELAPRNGLGGMSYRPTSRSVTQRSLTSTAALTRSVSGLTLGPVADLESSPDWEVDFDFEGRRFAVTAKPHAAEGVQQQIGRLFPCLDFVEEDRELVGDRIRITGSMTENGLGRR